VKGNQQLTVERLCSVWENTNLETMKIMRI
jgi:hypothetical protein